MTFGASSSVTLLFDFWSVHGPAGMVLSVVVVLLLAVFFEVLKVWRVWLQCSSELAPPPDVYAVPQFSGSDGISFVESSPSESSLTPMQQPRRLAPSARKRWLMHGAQAALHMLQVCLGYMLMLCVMSYNSWIFLGVVAGSVLGYFFAFPLLGRI